LAKGGKTISLKKGGIGKRKGWAKKTVTEWTNELFQHWGR